VRIIRGNPKDTVVFTIEDVRDAIYEKARVATGRGNEYALLEIVKGPSMMAIGDISEDEFVTVEVQDVPDNVEPMPAAFRRKP